MTAPRHQMAMLAAVGVALVLLVAAGLGVLTRHPLDLRDDTRIVVFLVSICLAGLLWLFAVALVRRGRLPPRTVWMVLVVAVAMRVMTLAGPPLLSTDVYRYVWDGRVQLAGISPYRYLPIAPQLEFLRDGDVYPHIGRHEYAPTIYPPAAQALFALAAVAAPGVFGMKLVMAAFDALAIAALGLLLRAAGRDPAELLIYAWLPLPVWEFVGNAHVDAVVAGLLALALLVAVRGRVAWTGVILAAATLTKFLPAAVLPAFWRPPDWRLPAAFAVTLAAFYLPYAWVGWQVFGFLGGYVSEEGFENGRGIFLLDLLGNITTLPAWAPKAYIALALIALGAIAVRFAFGAPLPAAPGVRVLLQARQAVILGAAVLVAVSPHYPWYFGWLAPLACLAPLPSVLWMLAAAPLLAHGAFEYLAVPGAVYGPAAILAVLDLRRSRTRPSPMPPQAVRSV
jgi:alpha-1,6-mannosyltransferase